MPDATPTAEQVAELARRLAALEAAHGKLSQEHEATKRERDEYRRVYLALLEAYRKLEAGLIFLSDHLGPRRLPFSAVAIVCSLGILTSVAIQPEKRRDGAGPGR